LKKLDRILVQTLTWVVWLPNLRTYGKYVGLEDIQLHIILLLIQLKAKFKLALDGFGTGYSSLSHSTYWLII
jgi:hypothetical protein